MYADFEDEDGEGWMPVARRKDEPTRPNPEPPASNAEVYVPPDNHHDTRIEPVNGGTNEQVAITSESEEGTRPLRRSTRTSKGVPPKRFGYATEKGQLNLLKFCPKQSTISWRHLQREAVRMASCIIFICIAWMLSSAPACQALSVEICDCSAPKYAGVLSFQQYVDCGATLMEN